MMLWRPDGESIVDLNDLPACLRHATKGCLRSAVLAFSVRACGNLLLVFLRLKIPRKQRIAMMRHAVFGETTWRFSLILGTFSGLYKFLLNAFPILIPSLNIVEKTKSSEVQLHDLQQTVNMRTMPLRKRAKGWHAALAGAIAGGLAMVWEKDGKARVIAQEAFFKGLQGSYNSFTAKYDFQVPHGDVLLFSLAVAQIMYAFCLRPDTLLPSYRRWIGEAGKIPPEAIQMNLDLVRRGAFDVLDLDEICKKSDITPANLTHLEGLRTSYFSSSSSVVDHPMPRYAPCSAIHPTVSSCLHVPFNRFVVAFKLALPVYSVIHFVPSIFFKWQAFKQDPRRLALRAGLGSLRSSAFLGAFVVICYSMLCCKHNLHRLLTQLKRSPSTKANALAMVPQKVIDKTLLSRTSYWILGTFIGLSLFIEEKKRRAELVMYVLPKALESMWIVARENGLIIGTGKWGSTLLAATGMSMLMVRVTAESVFYRND